MVADVHSWLNNPPINFGWLVLGDESTSGTTKRFDTRESASLPGLTIQYTTSTPHRHRQLQRLGPLHQRLPHQSNLPPLRRLGPTTTITPTLPLTARPRR